MNYEDDELERMRARREQRRSRSAGAAKSEGSASEHGKNGTVTDARSHKKGARKGGAKKKKTSRLLIAEFLILIALVITAVGCYAYKKTFGSLQKVEFSEENVMNLDLSEEQLEVMKGYWNVACFGVDSRLIGGKANVGKGTNSDVNLIASINLETGEIRLVSVFRDTYLNINDRNSYNKLNYAYAQGGPEQAVKALNKNLGLNITQYATFNWKAVADAINILGGVDIHLSESEFSWINAFITETVKETGIGSHQLTHAGDVHLDGVQAVAYGRLRMGDTDYARTERQRIILQQAFDKAKQADWNTLNCIIETIMPQLATNISPADLIPLARNITKYHIGETAGFPSARGETRVGKLGDCVIPQTLEFNVRELHKFLFGDEEYQVPSNVLEYSNHIASATGMATEGKVIGHVAVDKGISANSYIRRQQKKVSDRVAETAEEEKETEKSTAESVNPDDEPETDENGDLIEEPETDENGDLIKEPETDENGDTIEAPFDPEEDWLNGEWGDGWYDDEWNHVDSENGGPGTGSLSGPGIGRPGSSDDDSESQSDDEITKPGTTKPGTTKPGSTDKTDGEDDESESGVGPGASEDAKTSSSVKPGSSAVKPGSSTTTSGSSQKAPGSSTTTSGGSQNAPGSSTTTSGSGKTAPVGVNDSGNSSSAPGSSVLYADDSEGPSGPGV